jgi:plastocyanin
MVFSTAGLVLLQTPQAARADDDDQKKLSVTVTFGAGLNTGGAANHHVLPQTIRVKAGGVVNFAVAGFHQIFVYKPGITPEAILAVAPPFIPGSPPINLFMNVLMTDLYYQGLNPAGGDAASAGGANPGTPLVNLFNRDNTGNRVEAVAFLQAGTYLVICNVNPHFRDGMWAWVTVTDDDD